MKKDKNKQPKKGPTKQAAFLTAYSECGVITRACEISGSSRSVHYTSMEEDAAYPALFAAAREAASDKLETEARRRAVEGVSDPVYYLGKPVGVVQKYSDTLLIFLMKGANPAKYRENVTVSGDPDKPITHVHKLEERLASYAPIVGEIARGTVAGNSNGNGTGEPVDTSRSN